MHISKMHKKLKAAKYVLAHEIYETYVGGLLFPTIYGNL